MGKPNKPLITLSTDPDTAVQDEQVLALKEAHDREWAICARDFWYFAEGYLQTDDEERKSIRPFPKPSDWPNLARLHDACENYQAVVVRKARRQMVTNYAVARQFWKAFFAGSEGDDVNQIFFGCIISIGEVEANDLMSRISKLNKRLPEWMKSRNPIEKDNEMLKFWPKGGRIQAFPSKKGGPQGFGFSEVFFDEMSRQPEARSTWEGLIPTMGAHGKLLAISTPDGEDNLYFDVWTNKDGAYNDVFRVDMDWWEPKEHTQEWFDKVTAKLRPTEIARMYLKSFVGRESGKPVWHDVYNDQMHCIPASNIEVNPNSPILLGFDLGYHYPALCIAQHNKRSQFVGIAEFIRYDMDLCDFCDDAILFLQTLYDRNKVPEIIFLPPDSRQMRRVRSRLGNMTDWKDIEKRFAIGNKCQIRMGANKLSSRDAEPSRLKEVRRAFKLRKDGEPGFYFSDQMTVFRQGCQAGYCYPEPRFGVQSEEPEENRYTHIQDGLQMIVTGFNRFFSGEKLDEDGNAIPHVQTNVPRPRIGSRTGL